MATPITISVTYEVDLPEGLEGLALMDAMMRAAHDPLTRLRFIQLIAVGDYYVDEPEQEVIKP